MFINEQKSSVEIYQLFHMCLKNLKKLTYNLPTGSKLQMHFIFFFCAGDTLL